MRKIEKVCRKFGLWDTSPDTEQNFKQIVVTMVSSSDFFVVKTKINLNFFWIHGLSMALTSEYNRRPAS